MAYDYLEAVKADVKDYIEENITLDDYRGERDRLEEELNDDLWTADSVTGNASGSYTFNSARAREYCLEDMETIAEALKEFCTPAETIAEKFLAEDWEYFDVTARCYVLGSAIYEALEELEAEGVFDEVEEEEPAEETAGTLDRVAAAVEGIGGAISEVIRGQQTDSETVTA